MACDNGQNILLCYTDLSFLLMSVNTGAYFFEFLFVLFWHYYLPTITNKCGVSHLEKEIYILNYVSFSIVMLLLMQINEFKLSLGPLANC